MKSGPKVLVLDIETAPILAYVWSLWEQNVALNQIKEDWYIISWAAKWLGQKRVMQADQRKAKAIDDDTAILKPLWKLLDEADIVLTQNGKSFDSKKINARFVLNRMKPPSPYRHIDTKILAKRHFAFTSNRLEYMTDKLCTKYKKLKHEKFSGFELWSECLKGNQAAWREMAKYNKYDVLALEELYYVIAPWDSSIDFNAYTSHEVLLCQCGSPRMVKHGFAYKNSGKFQKYVCRDCGAFVRDKTNLLGKEKRRALRPGA